MKLKLLLDELETYAHNQRRALENPEIKVSPLGRLILNAHVNTMLEVVEETTTLIRRNEELEALVDEVTDEADEYKDKLREIKALCRWRRVL